MIILRTVCMESGLFIVLASVMLRKSTLILSYHLLQKQKKLYFLKKSVINKIYLYLLILMTYVFNLRFPLIIFFINLLSLLKFEYALDKLIYLDICKYMIKGRIFGISIIIFIFDQFQILNSAFKICNHISTLYINLIKEIFVLFIVS